MMHFYLKIFGVYTTNVVYLSYKKVKKHSLTKIYDNENTSKF